jgi:4-hydroxybenzoate polyprenyltransferase
VTPALATKIVDLGQLAQVVYVALIAGIGVSLAFSLVIRGTVRAGEHRRSRPIAAGAHALLAILGMLVVLAAIGFGISTMLSK